MSTINEKIEQLAHTKEKIGVQDYYSPFNNDEYMIGIINVIEITNINKFTHFVNDELDTHLLNKMKTMSSFKAELSTQIANYNELQEGRQEFIELQELGLKIIETKFGETPTD